RDLRLGGVGRGSWIFYGISCSAPDSAEISDAPVASPVTETAMSELTVSLPDIVVVIGSSDGSLNVNVNQPRCADEPLRRRRMLSFQLPLTVVARFPVSNTPVPFSLTRSRLLFADEANVPARL